MTTPEKRGAPAGEKLLRTRQRQKLIEACITALHIHGPSRTTIDKVVGIAGMSPGIVNFYFETKAALLLAALDHLAVEFDGQVMAPLQAMRDDPITALQRLVALYLDPDIASPRKVSVWYSFWGEASSRHEYLEICGKRDTEFAALVHDLVARLIGQMGAGHLDAEGIALGLIGALEMTWQDIAFHEEAELDRPAARQRCLAYLRSVFPAPFSAGVAGPAAAPGSFGPRSIAGPDAALAEKGYGVLVAAELALAGMKVVAVPEGWPGYDLLAQPDGTAPQRIVVRAARSGHGAAVIGTRMDQLYDWLAIVIQGPGGRSDRQFYIIPHAAAAARAQAEPGPAGGRPHICHIDSVARLFADYRDNFTLNAAPARPAVRLHTAGRKA